MEDRGSKLEEGGADSGTFRLFVAISLPDSVKDEIETAQRQLRDAFPSKLVRWTKREQFHLTLKFLGNVDESRVAELSTALRGACMPFSEMRLRAERIGFFPDDGSPRVVWAGVRDAKNLLPQVHEAIETVVRSITRERADKTFTGHVTLGRIQRIRRQEAETLAGLVARMAELSFGEWMANKVELIRSELSSSGSRYTTLTTIPLCGKE